MRKPHYDVKHADNLSCLCGLERALQDDNLIEVQRESHLEASYREEEEQRQRRARINAMKKANLVAALKSKDASFARPGTGACEAISTDSANRRGRKGGVAPSRKGVSFGPSVDLSTETGRAILNRKSINATLGEKARRGDTERYLDYLEEQDKMVAKMEKVTSVKTKCVHCSTSTLTAQRLRFARTGPPLQNVQQPKDFSNVNTAVDARRH